MKLNVLLVSDQVRGIDGTGGLGDVAAGLAKALAKRDDLEIRLLMPGYEKISEKNLEARFADVVIESLAVPLGDRIVHLQVCRVVLPTFSADEPRVTCYLLRQPELFEKRENSGLQAVLLARGAIAFMERSEDFRPDLVHCNDWHTALIPVYLNTVYQDHPYLSRIATLYTIHNNTGGAYQGMKPINEVLPLAGLPHECYHPGATRSVEFFGHFNHAKGGIGYSDLVNTVSLTYAKELRSPVFGGGLDKVVEDRASELCGIVNGIDTEEWNPASDPFLSPAYRFSATDSLQVIREKKIQLRELLRKWKTTDSQQPFATLSDESVLIGVVTRMSEQKMPILLPLIEDTGYTHDIPSPIERICDEARSQGKSVQWIVLGNADRSDARGQRYVSRLHQLCEWRPDDVTFFDGFDIGLSHLIYAASELFVVSSSFEPCGLTQLTSMRYGSIPVVRSVGGLRDTVIDERSAFEANGFKFLERDDAVENWTYQAEVRQASELLVETLHRAIGVRDNETRWGQLLQNGMLRDSSWTIPAAQYRRLYDEAVQQRVHQSFCRPRTAREIAWQVSELREQFERLFKLPVTAYSN
ncbi:MAG: glycogen/starch synthase, ADP-glucose type [Planctomycetaceae bacterium]|nr:glycogen/starch synthase, ADP-glucose type [Planctomycetaceae bacterium]